MIMSIKSVYLFVVPEENGFLRIEFSLSNHYGQTLDQEPLPRRSWTLHIYHGSSSRDNLKEVFLGFKILPFFEIKEQLSAAKQMFRPVCIV